MEVRAASTQTRYEMKICRNLLHLIRRQFAKLGMDLKETPSRRIPSHVKARCENEEICHSLTFRLRRVATGRSDTANPSMPTTVIVSGRQWSPFEPFWNLGSLMSLRPTNSIFNNDFCP